MKKYSDRLHDALQSLVSKFSLVIAAVIAFYMIFLFSIGVWNFIGIIPDFLTGSPFDEEGSMSIEDLKNIEKGMLHTIAFSIILIKAFRILLYYSKTFHLNIKYLVEISVIASAIEIFFNTASYDLSILMLFGAFGLGNLLIYVVWFEKFKKIGADKH